MASIKPHCSSALPAMTRAQELLVYITAAPSASGSGQEGHAEEAAWELVGSSGPLPASRRFHHSLTNNNRWIRERSHESYAKNYSVVFPHDEPLAGRNVRKDPLHEVGHGPQPRRLCKQRWETLQHKRGGQERLQPYRSEAYSIHCLSGMRAVGC